MPGCCWEAAEGAWWFGQQQPGAALINLNLISLTVEFVVKSAELLLI